MWLSPAVSVGDSPAQPRPARINVHIGRISMVWLDSFNGFHVAKETPVRQPSRRKVSTMTPDTEVEADQVQAQLQAMLRRAEAAREEEECLKRAEEARKEQELQIALKHAEELELQAALRRAKEEQALQAKREEARKELQARREEEQELQAKRAEEQAARRIAEEALKEQARQESLKHAEEKALQAALRRAKEDREVEEALQAKLAEEERRTQELHAKLALAEKALKEQEEIQTKLAEEARKAQELEEGKLAIAEEALLAKQEITPTEEIYTDAQPTEEIRTEQEELPVNPTITEDDAHVEQPTPEERHTFNSVVHSLKALFSSPTDEDDPAPGQPAGETAEEITPASEASTPRIAGEEQADEDSEPRIADEEQAPLAPRIIDEIEEQFHDICEYLDAKSPPPEEPADTYAHRPPGPEATAPPATSPAAPAAPTRGDE